MSISKYNLARVCSVLFSSTILIVNDTINCKNTNFRWLIYHILSFFVGSSQNMLQMLSKSALAAYSKRLTHDLFSLLCSFTIRMVEVCQAFPYCMIGFPFGRRTLFLNRRSRQFFILIAALRPVSLRLQSLKSKNTHGYHWCNGVFYTDSFFDFRFSFWFIFWFSFDSDCALQDKWDFRRILVGMKLRILFFRPRIARI